MDLKSLKKNNIKSIVVMGLVKKCRTYRSSIFKMICIFLVILILLFMFLFFYFLTTTTTERNWYESHLKRSILFNSFLFHWWGYFLLYSFWRFGDKKMFSCVPSQTKIGKSKKKNEIRSIHTVTITSTLVPIIIDS